jgi:YVTN family beta-propeller protein
VRGRITVLACLSLLVGQLVLATSGAASDTSIALPSFPTGYQGFQHILVDDSAGYVFLSTVTGLDARDLSGGEVASSLTIGSADGLAMSADGAVLYVAEPADHAVAVIDTGTLTEVASITTSGVTPRTLALIGSALWFGYDVTVYSGEGGIGVIDLSAPTPAVTAPAAIVNDTGTPVRWSGAPAITSSPAVPDTLFAGDRLSSPSPVESFTATGATLTLIAESDPAATSFVADLAVTADGADVLVTAGSRIARLRTSDLAVDGYLTGDSTMGAIAVAPDDGRIALGNAPSDRPAVYTFASDGTFEYQYAYQRNWGTAQAGLAYNATGSTLYAVTQTWDDSAPGGWRFELHVITNTHDTARPPAPEILTATPDYRAIDLTWFRLGLYDPANVDSFTIYRGTTPDQLAPYTQVTAAKTSVDGWADTGVAAGTRYYYAVTATNSGGESDRSPTASTIRNDVATVFVEGPYNHTSTGDVDLAYLSDNGPIHRITATSGRYSDPAGSPDGATVAYALTDITGTHLWRMPLAGGTAQQLTSGSAADRWPTWSPDGSTIAFTRTTSAGTSVWTVPASGGTPVQVPGTAGDNQPSWSPGGALLALTHGSGSTSQIVVTSLNGTYRRAVTGTNGNLPSDKCYSSGSGATYQTFCHYSGAGASWSPDGASLVFVQTTAGGTTPAIVPSAGGSVDYSLFEAFGHTGGVSWSSDGSRIVRSDNDTAVLWQSAPDGTGQRQVTALGGWADHPSVTGKRGAYAPLSHPSPVTGVTATLGTGAVTLRWTRPSDTGYVIIRRSAPNGAAPATAIDGTPVYTGTAASTPVTGLGNGTTYRFTIFSISPLGDIGGTASVTATPAAVPAVTPNGSILTALYGAGPAFTATWGKALPAGQVYDVQIGSRVFNTTTHTWSASPVWKALLTGTTHTYQAIKASAGTTYYLRARVRDSFGNATTWSSSASAPVPYDDRSAAGSTSWTEIGATGRFEGSLRTARQAGAALQWQTYGSQFDIITDRCATCGQVRIYVDGALRATVDTYASTTLKLQTIWHLRYAGIGLHTIRVVVVGTYGRPSVRVDGLVATR